YFATMRIPFVEGRDFTADDRAGGELVAIVGETTARRFWSGESAVGKPIQMEIGGPGSPLRTLRGVGIPRDVQRGLNDSVARLSVYLPWQPRYTPRISLVARTKRGTPLAGDIRGIVRSLDPNLPIIALEPITESMSVALLPQRIAASSSATLGTV